MKSFADLVKSTVGQWVENVKDTKYPAIKDIQSIVAFSIQLLEIQFRNIY